MQLSFLCVGLLIGEEGHYFIFCLCFIEAELSNYLLYNEKK